MPARMTKAQRAEKAQQAVELSARSVSVARIAEELEVSWPTARKLIDDELANRAEHRANDREKHISRIEAVQRAAWERFEKTDNKSLNASGYLNTILAGERDKVKLTGAEAAAKVEHTGQVSIQVVYEE